MLNESMDLSFTARAARRCDYTADDMPISLAVVITWSGESTHILRILFMSTSATSQQTFESASVTGSCQAARETSQLRREPRDERCVLFRAFDGK
jgi:hypothetical protein